MGCEIIPGKAGGDLGGLQPTKATLAGVPHQKKAEFHIFAGISLFPKLDLGGLRPKGCPGDHCQDFFGGEIQK